MDRVKIYTQGQRLFRPQDVKNVRRRIGELIRGHEKEKKTIYVGLIDGEIEVSGNIDDPLFDPVDVIARTLRPIV